LKISILAVAEIQPAGNRPAAHGRAEEEAITRGCKYGFVDTMDYQSPAFYQKLGYEIVGTIPDWDSHGHAKCFLTKGLLKGFS